MLTPDLLELNVRSNLLQRLDITRLAKLTKLDAGRNALTDIAFGDGCALASIDLSANQLELGV